MTSYSVRELSVTGGDLYSQSRGSELLSGRRHLASGPSSATLARKFTMACSTRRRPGTVCVLATPLLIIYCRTASNCLELIIQKQYRIIRAWRAATHAYKMYNWQLFHALERDHQKTTTCTREKKHTCATTTPITKPYPSDVSLVLYTKPYARFIHCKEIFARLCNNAYKIMTYISSD